MHYQYVTTDTSVLKKFRGRGTDREILVNADPGGRIVLLYEPSKEEAKEAIEEYYSRRIQYWWDSVMMSVVTAQRKSDHPSRKAPFINGFSTIGMTIRGKETETFVLLRIPALKQHLPEKLSTKITDYCVSLPLDEQRTLLKTLCPININDLVKVASRRALVRVLQIDFLKCLSLSDCYSSFLDTLVQILHDKEGSLSKGLRFYGSKQSGSSRILELLGWLNQKKWILLNKKTLLSLRYHPGAGRCPRISRTLGVSVYWNDESVNLAKEISEEYRQGCDLNSVSVSHGEFWRLCLLLRSTTIESIGDFSPELLDFNQEYLELPLEISAHPVIRRLSAAIVRSYEKDQRYSHLGFPITEKTPIGHPKVKKPEESLRSRGFRWILESHPEFISWVELFEEYRNAAKLQRSERLISAFNRWLKYLSELESPPVTPEEVNRAKHIKNVCNQSVKTYYKYIETTVASFSHRNYSLMSMRHFFDYYQEKLILNYQARPAQASQFINPIKADDGWNYKNRRKTHRYAFGGDLLGLLQEIILDRDQEGNPTFNWAKSHPAFVRDWKYEVDPVTKETKKVWWPGRAIAIYMLLALPLRSSQVLWLDEGLGDEYIYDFDKQNLIPNPHPSAVPGRREGAFRLVEDPFHGSSFLGLWVNTNKTKQYDPTVVRGYEIPWPNDELFSILRIMVDWNKKYFPNPKPVTIADDHKAIPTEAVKPFMPQFYVLFRDKTSDKGRNPNLPINDAKLTRIWGYLLAEAESRLKEQGKQVELVEWKPAISGQGYPYKFPRAKYDLHSLRVSGITSLIEHGIPVHLISEFIVGHSTIIMTLYYEKSSPYKVREMLRQAQNNAESDLDRCVMLLEQIDDPESVLVWNKLDSSNDSALQALKANKGLWQVEFDGICPGTRCDEGGPLDGTGNATSVPTGACGLCRYYVTGPAFLYGQMQKLNNLMYSMREKGEELVDLRRKAYDLEDSGSRRSLVETQGRRDRIECELKDTIHEWCNRYLLFQASLVMLDQYQEKKRKHAKGSKSLMPLLTANTQDGFKAIVTEATNIGLVRQISLMHEVLGNFDLHKGPLVEYDEILNTILINNGFDALLVTIPKEKRVAAANLLGEFLINSIGDDAIDKLFNGDALPQTLREQTHRLLEYMKSDKFAIDSLVSTSESQIPQQYLQIKSLKS